MLHEAIYWDGFKPETIWAAEAAVAATKEAGGEEVWEMYEGKPVWTGEMVRKWMFDDFAELRCCKEKMAELEQWDGWSKLYDLEKLKTNEVPVYSAVYIEDM